MIQSYDVYEPPSSSQAPTLWNKGAFDRLKIEFDRVTEDIAFVFEGIHL